MKTPFFYILLSRLKYLSPKKNICTSVVKFSIKSKKESIISILSYFILFMICFNQNFLLCYFRQP